VKIINNKGEMWPNKERHPSKLRRREGVNLYEDKEKVIVLSYQNKH